MTDPKLISRLTPEMQAKVAVLLDKAKAAKIDILIYCGLRTLKEQAELYCKGFPRDVCGRKAHKLRYVNGLIVAAQALEAAIDANDDSQDTSAITKAAPGESFHNYGLAVDCVPLVNGKAVWKSDAPEWEIYAKCVRDSGLFWAGDWKKFVELPHCQLVETSNPLDVYSADEALAKLTAIGAI